MRKPLLLLSLLLLLLFPLRADADGQKAEIPVSTEGTLVIFEAEGLRCALYVNESGMAGGAGTPSCVRLTALEKAGKGYTKKFQILQVIKTSRGK